MTIFADIFSKNAFMRHVTTLAAGTAIGQILTVLVSPVLTRLYGPEAFGIFGVFSAVAGIAAIISTLQFDMAAVLPDDEKDAISLIVLAFILAMVTFALCLSASIVFRGGLAQLLGFGNHKNILWMLAFLMLGYSQCPYSKQLGSQDTTIFPSIIVLHCFGCGGQCFQGRCRSTWIWGSCPFAWRDHRGFFFQSACLAFVLPKTIIHSKPSSEGWGYIKRVASTHIDFAIYRTPQISLNAFSSNLPGILFTALFSPAAAGLYYIAYRVLQMPSQLVADAVKKAFYPKAAKIVNANGDLRLAVVKATLMLGLVGAVPTDCCSFLWSFSFFFCVW